MNRDAAIRRRDLDARDWDARDRESGLCGFRHAVRNVMGGTRGFGTLWMGRYRDRNIMDGTLYGSERYWWDTAIRDAIVIRTL